MTEHLIHEGKHAEQDGLLVRRAIDRELRGDNSGRNLSQDEIKQIAKRVFRVDDEQSRAIVEDVNKQRAGRPLTESELRRAGRLEASLDEFLVASDAPSPKQILDSLRKTYTDFFEPKTPGSKVSPIDLLDDEHFFDTFMQEDNIDIHCLKSDYDALNGRYGTPEQDDGFAERVVPIIKEALLDEIKVAEHNVANKYDDYRRWFHEREACAVSDAVKSFVPASDDLLKDLFVLYKSAS